MALDTQTNVDKEINEGILRTYLGVDDPTDIDFGTYKTLLREKITAARMGGSDMDSSDISYLTNEFLRIKNIEPAKTKKIDINKFVKKAEEKKKKTIVSAQKLFKATKDTAASSAPKAEKVSNQKLLPPSKITPTPQDEVDDFYGQDLDDLINEIRNDKEETQAVIDNLKKESEEQKKILNMLTPSFASMEENLEDILGNTKEQTKLREDAVRQADKIEQTTERKDREAQLESTSKTPKVGNTVKKAEKATKPMGGFLDMILNFFKNILLGGALVALMNIIENPGKMLNPIIENMNGFIEFINNVLEKMFNVILFIPNKIIDTINFGIGFVTDRINEAINLFGGDPIDKPQIPNFEAPEIPKIPLLEEGGASGGGESEMPAAGAEGGGMVPAMQEGGVVFSPIVNMATPKYNSGGVVNDFKMDAPKYNSGGVVNNFKMDTPRFIGGGSVNQNINPQTVNNFSYTSGGSITSNSGQKVSGMGADTQLIAAQPGEIVMSKPAVNYWGAGNLLAMNKEGGGTNKPKMGKVRGFSGGGIIEGAKQIIGAGKGVGDQCANTTRAALSAAGHPDAAKRTQIGDLDTPQGTAYNAPSFAASFGGTDMGKVITNKSQIKAGDIILWKADRDKGGVINKGAITHVGIAADDGLKHQYDHNSRSGFHYRPHWHSSAGTSWFAGIRLGESGGKVPSDVSSELSTDVGAPEPGDGRVDKPKPAAKVSSSPSPSKPSIPGAPTAGGTNVKLLPLGGGGKQQAGSASNAGQTRVDGFSPIDMNNPELIVIKSIYNVVG